MLSQAKNVFIVGIKGSAMANLAVILKKMGKEVTGSDLVEEFITDELLHKSGITFFTGFDTNLISTSYDLIIYSAAHAGDSNPLIVKAKKLGIKTVHQAVLLGELLKEFKTSIAVCGCHGKTTTSSLLSYALIKLGAKPSYLVGSSNFNEYSGGDYKSKEYFVIEADEYGINPPHDRTPKFNYLQPDLVLCTNIDFDHPDVYQDLESTKLAFSKFFNKKKLIACSDDLNLVQSINRSEILEVTTFGFTENSNLRILNTLYNQEGSQFELIHNQKSLGNFKILLFGEKNISNTAGVILTLLKLGFGAEQIKKAIKNFTGAKRRFEKVYEKNNTHLFDDYGHHPTEIEATVAAVRNRFPGRRVILIFQPHTYSRTQALLNQFAEKLSLADRSYVLPIFPSARENSNLFKVKSLDIEKTSARKNVVAVSGKTELIKLLSSNLRKADIILTIGAGDVYKLKDDIISVINSL